MYGGNKVCAIPFRASVLASDRVSLVKWLGPSIYLHPVAIFGCAQQQQQRWPNGVPIPSSAPLSAFAHPFPSQATRNVDYRKKKDPASAIPSRLGQIQRHESVSLLCCASRAFYVFIITFLLLRSSLFLCAQSPVRSFSARLSGAFPSSSSFTLTACVRPDRFQGIAGRRLDEKPPKKPRQTTVEWRSKKTPPFPLIRGLFLAACLSH